MEGHVDVCHYQRDVHLLEADQVFRCTDCFAAKFTSRMTNTTLYGLHCVYGVFSINATNDLIVFIVHASHF